MLKAALSLFKERGYDAVKLDEIAERAEVSVGTVYTYFKTKNELLLAVIVEDFELAQSCGAKVLTGPLQDPLTAINDMTRCHFFELKDGVTREMWRVAIAAFLRNPSSEFAIEYEKCLSKMKRQYVTLIHRLQDENLLSGSAKPTEFASILYNNANMCFMEFIRDELAPQDVLDARLQRHNKRLLHWANMVE